MIIRGDSYITIYEGIAVGGKLTGLERYVSLIKNTWEV